VPDQNNRKSMGRAGPPVPPKPSRVSLHGANDAALAAPSRISAISATSVRLSNVSTDSVLVESPAESMATVSALQSHANAGSKRSSGLNAPPVAPKPTTTVPTMTPPPVLPKPRPPVAPKPALVRVSRGDMDAHRRLTDSLEVETRDHAVGECAAPSMVTPVPAIVSNNSTSAPPALQPKPKPKPVLPARSPLTRVNSDGSTPPPLAALPTVVVEPASSQDRESLSLTRRISREAADMHAANRISMSLDELIKVSSATDGCVCVCVCVLTLMRVLCLL
jgi:hypothetical protein